MCISPADLCFAASLKVMSDEDFLLAWQGEVTANEESRVIMTGMVEHNPSAFLGDGTSSPSPMNRNHACGDRAAWLPRLTQPHT
jgi:hypothetical protein